MMNPAAVCPPRRTRLWNPLLRTGRLTPVQSLSRMGKLSPGKRVRQNWILRRRWNPTRQLPATPTRSCSVWRRWWTRAIPRCRAPCCSPGGSAAAPSCWGRTMRTTPTAANRMTTWTVFSARNTASTPSKRVWRCPLKNFPRKTPTLPSRPTMWTRRAAKPTLSPGMELPSGSSRVPMPPGTPLCWKCRWI